MNIFDDLLFPIDGDPAIQVLADGALAEYQDVGDHQEECEDVASEHGEPVLQCYSVTVLQCYSVIPPLSTGTEERRSVNSHHYNSFH